MVSTGSEEAASERITDLNQFVFNSNWTPKIISVTGQMLSIGHDNRSTPN